MSTIRLYIIATQVRDGVTGLPIAPAAGYVPTADGSGGVTWAAQTGGGAGPVTTLAAAAGSTGNTLVVNGTGPSLTIKGLIAGPGITLTPLGSDIQITNASPAITLSSSGAGNSLVKTGTGSALQTKSLIAGTGIGFSDSGNDITIINASPASSVTLASAGGTSLVASGTGPALTIKGITAGTGITFTPSGTDIKIDSSGSATPITLTSAGGANSLVTDGTGPDLSIKGITAGTSSGIALLSSGTALQLASAVKAAQFTFDTTNRFSGGTAPLIVASQIVGDAFFPANSTATGSIIKMFAAITAGDAPGTFGNVEIKINTDPFVSLEVVGAGDTFGAPSTIDIWATLYIGTTGNIFAHLRTETMLGNGTLRVKTFRSPISGAWFSVQDNTVFLNFTSSNATGGMVVRVYSFDMQIFRTPA